MKMKLNDDVVSNMNGLVYGKKDSEVTVIEMQDRVAIVEDERGNRFSCAPSKLDPLEGELPPVSAAPQQLIPPATPKGKSKKANKDTNQQSFF